MKSGEYKIDLDLPRYADLENPTEEKEETRTAKEIIDHVFKGLE